MPQEFTHAWVLSPNQTDGYMLNSYFFRWWEQLNNAIDLKLITHKSRVQIPKKHSRKSTRIPTQLWLVRIKL